MLCAVDVRRTYAYLAWANRGYKAKATVIQFPKVLEDASFHADKKNRSIFLPFREPSSRENHPG